MLKMTIDNEEVISKNNFTIKEEMLSASSTILNNCYPKTWEQDHDYTTRFYYPKDYSKMTLNKETYIAPESGSNITINGSATIQNVDTTKEMEYTLKGDTSQYTTTGKSLYGGFDFTKTTSGITYTYNINGTIGAKGTATGQALSMLSSEASNGRLITLEAGTYTISGGLSNITLELIDSNGNNLGATNSSQFYRTITITSSKQVFMRLNIANGTNVSSGVVVKAMLEKSSTPTTYEPYTGSLPSPSPDYPQEVQTATGRQEIDIVGKNLFDKDNLTSGFINTTNGSITTNANWQQSDYIKIIPSEKYTISNSISMAGAGYFEISKYDENKGWLSSTQYGTSGTKTYTYTNDSNTHYIKLGVYKLGTSTDDIQLEKSNSATTYEPYKGQSYEVNLGKNLAEDRTLKQGLWCNSTSISNNSSGWYVIEKCLPNTTYTISKKNTTGTIYVNFTNIYPTNGATTGQNNQGASGRDTLTFTTPNNANYIFIGLFAGSPTDTQKVECIEELQLERGSQATSYSEYFTPIELCKIGNYQDFIRKGTGKNLISSVGNKVGNTIYFNGSSSQTDYQFKAGTYTLSFVDTNTIQVYMGTSTTPSTKIGNNSPQTFTANEDFNIWLYRSGITLEELSNVQLEKGNQATLFEPYGYKDKWYIYKAIGKYTFTGDESWSITTNANYDYNLFSLSSPITYFVNYARISGNTTICNYFKGVNNGNGTAQAFSQGNNVCCFRYNTSDTYNNFYITNSETTANNFKTLIGNLKPSVYYVLSTPTTTEITNSELVGQLNGIELLSGINNITISSFNLPAIMDLHYNFVTERTDVDLIFSGIVKNTNDISLNPREPKYCSLEILDYKTLLSEGDTLDYVISNKTILEAIDMVVNSIASYGFELGNVNILNGNDIIGAYSTYNKTAYDVLQYLADISGAKWTCRQKDDNSMYIDFYDPTLMPQGKQIEYTNNWAEENNLIDLKFNYGTRDYRNKQIILSDEVIGDIDYTENFLADSFNTDFVVQNNIASISEILVNGLSKTFGTTNDKEIGIYADFYYTPGDNVVSSNEILESGNLIQITYKPIIKGREVVQNDNEINRLNTQLEVNGTIARYDTRNDETDSSKLLAIGETYLRYKGEAEITLTLKTFNNDLYEIGQMVYFNAPIQELAKNYMVKSKEINVIASGDDMFNIFYTYTLSSSFNAERQINWFDNQRNKTTGNIGEGEYVSRNVDISSTATIIWDNVTATEITGITGNNELDSPLDTPFNE